MNRNIRTLIVDDEPLALDRLRMLLAGLDDIELVGECRDGVSAVAAIGKLRPDLLFLDVQMPELDGFGVVDAVGPNCMPVTIFVTAYDQYALRAFDVSAVDYLLKPFDRARFLRAMARARKQIGAERQAGEIQLMSLLQLVRTDAYLERLVVKSGGRISFLKADEVDWIESAGNYVRLHVGRDAHMLRDTMSEIESKLDPRKFVRIHRRTMVNLERIRDLQPLFHGDHTVTLRDGGRLTLSRSYRENLERVLGRAL